MRAIPFVAFVVAAALAGCSKSGTTKQAEGAQATSSEQPASGPVLSPEEQKAALEKLPAPFNTADLANGEAKFALCKSCHTIAPGGGNMTGPNLYGIFGRKAGTAPDFNYSDAVKAAGFTWEFHHLDSWLSDPRGFLPGTKMTFMGFKDPKDRTDVIAYVAVESGYKPPAP